MITHQISKMEKNEDYWKNRWRFDTFDNKKKKKNKEMLSVTITEEQFEAIRKAVLEVF